MHTMRCPFLRREPHQRTVWADGRRQEMCGRQWKRPERRRLETMRCMCGSREHRNSSLRPLRWGGLVVRASEAKALGESECEGRVPRPTHKPQKKNDSKAATRVLLRILARRLLLSGQTFAMDSGLTANGIYTR